MPLIFWGGAALLGAFGFAAGQAGDAVEQTGDAAKKTTGLVKWAVVGGCLYVGYKYMKKGKYL